MEGRIVTINGKRWRFRWHAFGREKSDGDCDNPNTAGKEIRVRNSLRRPERQRRLLEVSVHEALHALNWHISEESVGQGAEDIANLLWKLGFRRS